MEKWDPLQAPIVSSVVDYFNTVLQTTFPITLAAFQLFFVVDALVVLAFMEHFFPEKANDPQFPMIMRPIEFLVLSVYSIFLQNQFSGYVEPVERYYSMLQQVESLVPYLKAKENAERILFQMIDFVVQINRPKAGNPVQARKNYQHLLTTLISTENSSFDDRIQDVMRLLRSIELSQRVKRPDLVQNYVFTFLSLWFGIWLPISMWCIIGFSSTLFLYPSFMYVLWGPSIHKFWLGSPWDDDRVFRENKHSLWADEFKEKITVMVSLQTE